MNIDWDIEELAYRAMGKTEIETDEEINNGDIEQAVFDKYDISFEQYLAVVKDLIKFTPLVSSPLTDTTFHAFVDIEQQRAIVKLEI